MKIKKLTFAILGILGLFLFQNCDNMEDTDPISQGKIIEVDPSFFITTGLTAPITTVPCTLSNGKSSACYKIVTNSIPDEHQLGPWCPTTITDGKEKGGLWFEGGKIYDVDGAFVKNMKTFYSNSKWLMYKEDGTINVTKSQAACQAAARPDVDPQYQNFCVECQPSYFTGTLSFLIPVTPVLESGTTSGNGMGVRGIAFNGVHFDPPAPTDRILGSFTLAPMDDCGGHVNLASGYHYHAATGCSKEIAQTDGHAPMIGYAMDGFGIFARLDPTGAEPLNLDTCRGHSDDVRGYHYHVAPPGDNNLINCLKGAQGSFSVI